MRGALGMALPAFVTVNDMGVVWQAGHRASHHRVAVSRWMVEVAGS